MTRVDFYLLSESHRQGRWLFACRLCEKAYQKNHKIYILVSSPQEVQELDELLWTFQADSFLPHEIYQDGIALSSPIQIGLSNPANCEDILINLTASVPTFYSQFQRIIEIITGAELDKAAARQNFRSYREKGCQIESHQIKT